MENTRTERDVKIDGVTVARLVDNARMGRGFKYAVRFERGREPAHAPHGFDSVASAGWWFQDHAQAVLGG